MFRQIVSAGPIRMLGVSGVIFQNTYLVDLLLNGPHIIFVTMDSVPSILHADTAGDCTHSLVLTTSVCSFGEDELHVLKTQSTY